MKTLQQIQLEQYELYKIKKEAIRSFELEAMKTKYGITGTTEEQNTALQDKQQDLEIEKESLLKVKP